MGKTLYDLLEVSPSAGKATIDAAYSGLSEKLRTRIIETGATDAEIQLKAVQEAYKTLSDQHARDRYDASLARKNLAYEISAEEESPPFWTTTKTVVFGLVILIGGMAYLNHRKNVEHERTEQVRIAAEKAEKELQAKQQAEEEKLASEEESRKRAEAQREQWQLDQDRRYADHVSSNLSRQEYYERQRMEREQRMEQQRADMEQRRREQEARYQAELEKRKLRELEYQNRHDRPSVIAVPR